MSKRIESYHLCEYVDKNYKYYDKNHICYFCESGLSVFEKGRDVAETTLDANPCPFAFFFRLCGGENEGEADSNGFYQFYTSDDKYDGNSTIVKNELGECVFRTKDNGGGYNVNYCRAYNEIVGIKELLEKAVEEDENGTREKERKEFEEGLRKLEEEWQANNLTEDLPFE